MFLSHDRLFLVVDVKVSVKAKADIAVCGQWEPFRRRYVDVNKQPIIFTARILRKQPDLPRYVVVRPEYAVGRTEAFSAKISLNGSPSFARNVRPWGKGSDVFFFNLTQPQCQQAGLDTGDECEVRIEPQA